MPLKICRISSMIWFRVLLLHITVSSFLISQDSLVWMSPVDHDVRLSGNFMELRTNHFHTGIDIKSSTGKPGDTIRVVADGFVSRIKVQNGGYGQVVYLDHPNGYTSVYAHLHQFNSELEAYVKEMQYALESYELDIYPSDSLFKFKAGEYLGLMGNTGRSFGPHLHFEIRETESEKPIDPEAFGFAPDDHVLPTLQSFHVYHFEEADTPVDMETLYFSETGKTYSLHRNLIEARTGKIAFGVTAFDRIDGSSNRNGINAYRLFVNDSLAFQWKAENYSFAESKRINGFFDYRQYILNSLRIYKLFAPSCLALDFFEAGQSGILNIEEGKQYGIRIEINDAQGNMVSLPFSVVGIKTEDPLKASDHCDSSFVIKKGMFEISFEKESFFEWPAAKTIEKSQELVLGKNSHRLDVFDRTVPLAKYFRISCPLPPGDPNQWCYIMKDNRGSWSVFSSDTLGGKLHSYIDQCGTLFLYQDTSPPEISLIDMDESFAKAWIFKIKDNLIPDGKTPDLTYRASANGKWLRFKYDLKTDALIFDDFDKLPDTNFIFELTVSDAQGNRSSFEKLFIRQK